MRIFRKKPTSPEGETAPKKKWSWLRVSVIANVVILLLVIGTATGGAVIHQSNVNPNLCASCHIMVPNVDSYLTSNHLDNVHNQAGVECKGCHDYPVMAEIEGGIKYLTGNYFVTADGTIPKQEFGEEMCLDCHISKEYLANQTDFLTHNPHLSHQGEMQCNDCHVSHGEQIDACSECHSNGGQRMVEGPVIPRAENPWAEPDGERATLLEAVDAELTN